MAIDLMSLTEHKISRDLSGYITYIYGSPKSGKTSLSCAFPQALLIAFERGYNALPGVFAQDVTSWAEFKQVVRELKKPEVKEKFKSIIIDTIDIAALLCEKYILAQAGKSAINEIPYGNGYTLLKRELEDTFRTISQLGFALVFISHSKTKPFQRKDGTTYDCIVPTVSNSSNEIIKSMADLYLYAHSEIDGEGNCKRILTVRSSDGTIDCGSRFKYIDSEIPLDYDSLVAALNKAIDMEAELKGKDLVVNTKETMSIHKELNFDDLMSQFNSILSAIPGVKDTKQETEEGKKFAEYYTPRITEIIERYLGKGKKISNIDRGQVELLELIILDLKELVNK